MPGRSEPLPRRKISLSTDSVDAFAALQPERPRSIVQLQRGHCAIRLQEVSWGAAALQQESWSCGIRIQVDRPSSYDTFAIVTRAEGDTRWMGSPVERGAVVRIIEPWEAASSGRFEYVAFAVGRASLAEAARPLHGPEWSPRRRLNESIRIPDLDALEGELLRMLRAVELATPDSAALRAAEQDLIHLAARIDRAQDPESGRNLLSPSTRRAVVRRVEEFLDACGDAHPTITKLCEIAETSERTLEYAFREHLGMTPVRYLKIRRLNEVRRRLQRPESFGTTVTNVALSAGFYDLGRFAGEYRLHFGELPSATLARFARQDVSGSSQRPEGGVAPSRALAESA